MWTLVAFVAFLSVGFILGSTFERYLTRKSDDRLITVIATIINQEVPLEIRKIIANRLEVEQQIQLLGGE